MPRPQRQYLYDEVWTTVEPSIEGYSCMIQQLLELLTDEQLIQFALSHEIQRDDDA